jgi:hypothetical protein
MEDSPGSSRMLGRKGGHVLIRLSKGGEGWDGGRIVDAGWRREGKREEAGYTQSFQTL